MSKILLIEPHRVLQQAISLSLCPEHEVQVEEAISSSGIGSFKDYDLLIVDGAALREKGQLSPGVARAIQGSKIPTLWLEESESSHPPKREKLLIVKKPIEREAFQLALANLLYSQIVPRKGARSLVSRDTKAATAKGASKDKPKASYQETFQFIDLVDEVEGETPQGQEKQPPRKPK